MTLQQLAYLIAQVLTGQVSLLAAVQRINNQLAGNATEATAGAILTEVVSTGLAVADGTTGLVHAYNQARTDTAAILAAIAALPTGSGLVIPTASDNASAVWLQTDPNGVPARAYGDEIWEPYRLAKESAVYGLHLSGNAPGFAYMDTDNPSDLTRLSMWPTPDWSAILPADTRLSWLTRTDTSGLTWSQGATDGFPSGFDNTPPFPVPTWFLLLTEADFDALKAAVSTAAPIWPGLAGVTLGTPVALADGLVVTGPMAGVIVELSSVPPGGGHWSLGGMGVYYNWGQLAFKTDAGDLEAFQWLGPAFGVYLPKQMLVATSAHFRVTRAPTGTVTPFTIP